MIHLPLTTHRLRLRKLQMQDAPDLFELRSDASVNQYIQREAYEKPEQAIEFIQTEHEKSKTGEWVIVGVEEAESGRLIGTLCLFSFNEEKNQAELGYELNPAYQGKGYMTEAISVFIEHLISLHSIQKLCACIRHDNRASLQLIQRLNFIADETVENLPEGFTGWSRVLN